VLRVQSVLRRSARPAAAPETLADGDLTVDGARRVARRAGVELALTVRDLLVFLLRNQGRAFTRGQLLEAVWGWTFGDQSTVAVHVRRLIEQDPAGPGRTVTVWGVGYRYG
jgi:DNA-binding response OmpR family regulator